MEEFAAICFVLAIAGVGAFLGNINGTNDVSNKEILEANKVCESGGGVYKINKGFKEAIAFCKDGTNLTLKGAKE